MIVYSNFIKFDQSVDPLEIIKCVADWLGVEKRNGYIDPKWLFEGVLETKLNDGGVISAVSNISSDNGAFQFCARYSHKDKDVNGRKWVSEIGIDFEGKGGAIECSVLVKTEEASARVNDPIKPTRPKLIPKLISKCLASQGVVGLKIKTLDERSAPLFLSEVERHDRIYPIVLVSHKSGGELLVDIDILNSYLIGLADVVHVPHDVDTFRLGSILGDSYKVYDGAINIIFPKRQSKSDGPARTRRILKSDVLNIRNRFSGNGFSAVESEVLSLVTHYTNVPLSWKHISFEQVVQSKMRRKLLDEMELKKDENNSTLYPLLEEADKIICAKDDEISKLKEDLTELRDNLDCALVESESLKKLLKNKEKSERVSSFGSDGVLNRIGEEIFCYLEKGLSLYAMLEMASKMYVNRIIILDSAFKSAGEADKSDFKYFGKVAALIRKLSNEYWKVLAEGGSDQEAKEIFGAQEYASKESSNLSKDGKNARTFSYKGRNFLMEKHLKIGWKDSDARTLRIHFEWDGEGKLIVIGYCGKHLAL